MQFITNILQLLVVVAFFAGGWKMFEKAGKPGWGILIPFYNIFLMLGIAGKPGWWLILLFIPFVNLVIVFLTMMGIAEKFGKGIGFAIGLFFLGFIFIPWLGFGDATYRADR